MGKNATDEKKKTLPKEGLPEKATPRVKQLADTSRARIAPGPTCPTASGSPLVVALSFPCTATVVAAFGKYLPGDVLHLREAASFEVGKWLLIERGDTRMFAFAEDRAHVGKVLVTADGDELLFSAARHKIIGCVFGCFRRIATLAIFVLDKL